MNVVLGVLAFLAVVVVPPAFGYLFRELSRVKARLDEIEAISPSVPTSGYVSVSKSDGSFEWESDITDDWVTESIREGNRPTAQEIDLQRKLWAEEGA